MTTQSFAHAYILTDLGGGEYSVSPLSGFYPVKELRDDQDGTPDGLVADGGFLTFYLSPLTINVSLVGLDGTDGVVVTNGSTIYYLTDISRSAGYRVFPSDGTLNLNCFAAGTMIATPGGEKRVETLMAGDQVISMDGEVLDVEWVGSQTAHKFFSQDRMQPVRISAGALGPNVPHTDLVVTADHGMVVDGLMINASALVNGSTINWVPMKELPDHITFYHIETARHEGILANGAAAETFLDVATRRDFDNYSDYIDTHGAERIVPEMDMPRITSRRLLPSRVLNQLAEPQDWLQMTA